MVRSRLIVLLRLYITLLLIFATQKMVFMIFNAGLADGAPLGQCLLSVWHGLRLDSVMSCYLLLLPAVALLVGCFVPRMSFRRILAPYYVVAAILVAVIFVADTVLYLFWGAKLDANDLMYAAKPKDMLASLPWWAVVLGVAVIAALSWHYYRRLRHATPAQLPPLRSRWLTLLALPVAGLLFLGIRGGTSESTANPSYAYFSSYPFCNHAALNPTFNMLHSLFKAQNLETEFALRPDDEVDAMMADAFRHDPRVSDTLLRVQHPNVLLIIWESGGSGMVCNDSVGPCLKAIAAEGIDFTHCYANNFRTDRGLISVLNGWLGLPTTSLMKRPDLCRRLPSLAQTLRANGYATSFTYGGDIDFTNMRLYFLETGFDSVRGSAYFPASQYTSSWGVPDHYLLGPSLLPSRRPFFAATLTLSSHEPWDVPMHRLADQRQNAFAYTDSCIGAFVDYLRTTPLWDSLLVVIVPDHGVCFGDIHSTSDPCVAHIPLVWTGGAVAAPSVVERHMAQSDLAATLLAQMGIDASHFVYSRNVLAPTYDSMPHFALHAFKNGCNLITPDGVATYDCVDRSLQGTTDTTATAASQQAFVEALLQHLYRRSAQLAAR